MTFSLFSVAIILVFSSVAAIEIHRGIKKGFRLALVSLGTTLAAVLIAVLATTLLSSLISSFIYKELIGSISLLSGLFKSFSSTEVLLEAITAMIIGLFLFIAIFFCTRAIINGIVKIVCKNKMIDDPTDPGYSVEKDSYFDKHSKGLGAIVGAVTAVVVTMVLTCPIMGVLDVTDRSLDIAEKASTKTANYLNEEIGLNVDKYSDDLAGNVFYQLGGKAMFRGVTSARMYGHRVYLLSELEALDDATDSFLEVYKIIKTPGNVTSEHIDSINDLCNSLEQTRMFDGIIGDALSNGARSWKGGNSYMGIPRPSMNTLIGPAFDEILTVLENSDSMNAKQNVVTLLKVYSAILESGILTVDQSNYNSVLNCVSKSNIIARLDDILDANPYTSGISVSSIAMAAISEHLLKYNYNSVKYDNLMNNLADTINTINGRGYGTQEEKTQVLSTYAKKYIEEYGVSIPDQLASSTAEELLKTLSGTNTTADDIRQIFKKYGNSK